MSPMCHATGHSGAMAEMPTSPLIHVIRKYDLIGDVREGFSEKVIVDLSNRKKLQKCDSQPKFKLLDVDEIVRWVALMG